MGYRVALLGIYHESNTFIDSVTTLGDFEKGHWLSGDAILSEYRDAYHEIGGIIEVLESEGIEVVPVMYAEATPGGIISADTYAVLLEKMMSLLEMALPVDGCLVVPHGAAVSEAFPDMDGHWLSILRNRLGPDIPIAGTLDPHANVSHLMVSATDALIAYKTNPHIDQRETGRDAARLMLRMIQESLKPASVLRQLPLAISIEQQHTASEPCKSLYRLAESLSCTSGILSISILLGFPYADVYEMGSGIIVVTDKDDHLAAETAQKLEDYIISHKELFNGKKIGIAACMAELSKQEKPVLLLDMGDNVGGGAPGNSTLLLEALERRGMEKSFVCLYDPEAVLQAEGHDPGDSFTISLQTAGNGTVTMEVTLLRFADGDFHETSPRHGGQVHYSMGQTVIVSTGNGNVIMLISLRVPPFSLCQLTAFGIVPEDFDVIIAKGVNAPIAAYGPVCKTILKVDTPGVTQADMTLFDFNHRRKPLYPFENRLSDQLC